MKYFIFCFLFATTLFVDDLTLENKSSFSKISIEWASSARAVQESNEAMMQGDGIHPLKVYSLKRGQSKIPIPANASYFRVLVWKASGNTPELLTNWVEIVPGKTYKLKDEHLTSTLLLNGMGC